MDNHRNVYVRLLNNLEEYIEELKEMENVPFGYMVPPNRMCMAIIKCRVFNHDKFLCVSWLGPHNGMMNSDLKNDLRNLLIFISNMRPCQNLPIIIAGNFNISIMEESEILPTNFTGYEYIPLRRKHGENKDFFIGSMELPLSAIAALDWETEKDAPRIFTHDPVIAWLAKKKEAVCVMDFRSDMILWMCYVYRVHVNIGIADVGGPSKKGATFKRKLGLSNLIKQTQPDILLLQQCPWLLNLPSTRPGAIEIPWQYSYDGTKEAGILYQTNVCVRPLNNLEEYIEELKEMKKLPIGYTVPLNRMYMAIIQCIVFYLDKFLCVSWHGPHNGMKKPDLKNDLKNLLIFISHIGLRHNLPIIIGGNFNISIKDASEILPTNLTVYEYIPLRRKHGENKVFFIGSKELPLSAIAALDWETENIHS